MIKILSDEEMVAINNAQPSEAKYGDVFKAVARTQNDYTTQQIVDALKAIILDIEEKPSMGRKLINITNYIAELQSRLEEG